MKLFNPTDEIVAITFEGVDYTIAPKSWSDELSDETATYWKTMIHEFLETEQSVTVSDEAPIAPEVPVEAPVEDEEVEEPASEKKPKK